MDTLFIVLIFLAVPTLTVFGKKMNTLDKRVTQLENQLKNQLEEEEPEPIEP